MRVVGGDEVEVTVFATATEDPHSARARPSVVTALAGAQLLVVTGLGFESRWLLERIAELFAAGELDAFLEQQREGPPTRWLVRALVAAHAKAADGSSGTTRAGG